MTDHGEVYTNEREVKAMCDLVKSETERIDSRFLEPACGNGNFLAEILSRKLAVVSQKYKKSPFDYEKYSVVTITNLYGVDIFMTDWDYDEETQSFIPKPFKEYPLTDYRRLSDNE